MAHGSRDPRWRVPFERLAATLARDLGDGRVRLAYMEFASPSLSEVAEEARRDGVTRLCILPLFMAGGGHVDHDIPALAREVERLSPGLTVEVVGAVGEEPRVVAAIEEIARDLVGSHTRRT
jgi:sirohydrochlorin cobaltochelatase